MQMLVLHDHLAKRLRLRLFSSVGRLAREGRRLRLRLTARWCWVDLVATAISRLQALPAP